MEKPAIQGKQQYKYLTLISMLYMTIKLTTILLIYKVVSIGSISFSVSTVIIPFWFFLGTIVTETYGYYVARHLIWMAILFQFLFALVCIFLIHFDSPSWVNQEAYQQIFGKLPRVTIASFLAIVCGAFVNAYALAKYKILSKGRRFWLRSLKSSAIGELVFTIIAYLTEFIGMIPFQDILQLITISFLVKIVLSSILIIPLMIITKKLKKLEGVDVYDLSTNFNPFKLNLNVEKENNMPSNVVSFPQVINCKIVSYKE